MRQPLSASGLGTSSRSAHVGNDGGSHKDTYTGMTETWLLNSPVLPAGWPQFSRCVPEVTANKGEYGHSCTPLACLRREDGGERTS